MKFVKNNIMEFNERDKKIIIDHGLSIEEVNRQIEILRKGMNYIAVSYTHLDVYKRQGQTFAPLRVTGRPLKLGAQRADMVFPQLRVCSAHQQGAQPCV